MEIVKISTAELHVIELDGFLNSLRCLVGGPGRFFAASYISKDAADVLSIVQKQINNMSKEGCRVSKKEVNFKQISELFDQCIYVKIPTIDPDSLKNLDWSLVEYYGLISTAEDENGPWNRLVGQNHILLECISEEGRVDNIFFVEYESFVVATYIAKQ